MPQNEDKLLQDLVNKYAKILSIMAYKNGVPRDDAEDVAMASIYSFYKSEHYGKLDETDTKKMMTTIVKNKSIDHYRSTKKDIEMIADTEEEELVKIAAPPKYEPERQIFGDSKYSPVREAIENLKPIWREIVVMYYVEGYSYAEISKALGVSEETCRKRASRAKAYLEEELKPFLKK